MLPRESAPKNRDWVYGSSRDLHRLGGAHGRAIAQALRVNRRLQSLHRLALIAAIGSLTAGILLSSAAKVLRCEDFSTAVTRNEIMMVKKMLAEKKYKARTENLRLRSRRSSDRQR